MDGSGAPRANAAQMASRNIKSLKGGRGRGNRASPVPSSQATFGQSQASQPFQFQPPGGSASGGGFNFAAPGGSFNNPFANSNGQQLSENDERRDPGEEPFGKKGRHANGPDGDSVPLFAPIPSNPFGTVTNGQQQNGGMFSGFGQSNGVSVAPPQASTPTPVFAGFGQSQPASNAFNPTPAAQPSTNFNFSFGAPAASPQPQAASTPFSFGQTPSQPKSTGFQFGSTPANSAPTPNLFGSVQAAPTSLFGSAPQAPAANATTDLFGKKDALPAASFTFGATAQPPAPSAFSSSTPAASNPFGSRDASPAPPVTASNLFGSQAPSSSLFSNSVPATSNIFGQKAPSPAPGPSAPNPFSGLSQVSAPSMFSSSAPPANNLFASRDSSPANSTPPPTTEQTPKASFLFGSQSQQPASTATPSTLFGTSAQEPSILFGEAKQVPASTPFGTSRQDVSGGSAAGKAADQPSSTSSLFGSTTNSSTSDLFGNLNKPVEAAVVDPKPQTATLFGANTVPAPEISQPASSGNPFKFGSSSVSSLLLQIKCSQANTVKASVASPAPTSASPIKSTFSFGSSQATPPPAPQPAKASLSSPQKAQDAPVAASKPPPTGMFPKLQPTPQPLTNGNTSSFMVKSALGEETVGSAVQRIKNSTPIDEQNHDGREFKDLSIAKQIPDEYMKDFVPSGFTDDQRKDFYCAYRIRALNKAMANYFGGLQSAADPANAIKFYIAQRKSFMDEVNTRNARDVQAGSPSKQQKSLEPSRSRSPTRNASPAKQTLTSNGAPAQLNGTSAFEPSATVPSSTSSLVPGTSSTLLPPTNNVAPSPSKGKRKAEENLDQQNVDQMNKRPMRKIATPGSSGSTQSPGGGSSTSNIFKNILDSPSKAPEKSPIKKTANLPTPSVSSNATPKANPFGSLFVPRTDISTDKIVALSSFLLAAKTNESPKSSGFTPSKALPESKSTDTPKATAGGFMPAITTGFTPSAPATTSASIGFKMAGPTAGGPVNFASQFGMSAEAAERKKMLDEMEEDIDSDEDPEEWQANWKLKRREELEKLKSTSSSSGGFEFAPKKGNAATTSTSTEKSTTAGTPAAEVQPAKSLFNFGASAHTPNGGLFSPANLSRTTSPSPAPSSSGSVFDSTPASKPVTFGSNIFGHLSKPANDSDKHDDADDESGDEAEIDHDSENKDPNYTPGQESSSGPGTPVEETGAGIASAKKANLFGFPTAKAGPVFGGSPSGTTTPGGSLMSRITRDTSAKLASPASSEEKENAQPTGVGLFAGLNKSQNGPADQTWKIDSPIKFGSATPSGDSPTPTVNITTATPTKTSTPGGLFSSLNKSTAPTSAPFSNLFGNSSATKPSANLSAGFTFGGASSTPSLFASANTSRATTPGATTDGESTAEDPDAEKHEQISLTSGAGEEDESVQLEIRAKALLYGTKDDGAPGWNVKGLGVLKILKHKETGSSRILLRAEPRGNIVLNKSILNREYEAVAKTVKLATASDTGKSLETWLLQVKNDDIAKQLAEALKANKATT